MAINLSLFQQSVCHLYIFCFRFPRVHFSGFLLGVEIESIKGLRRCRLIGPSLFPQRGINYPTLNRIFYVLYVLLNWQVFQFITEPIWNNVISVRAFMDILQTLKLMYKVSPSKITCSNETSIFLSNMTVELSYYELPSHLCGVYAEACWTSLHGCLYQEWSCYINVQGLASLLMLKNVNGRLHTLLRKLKTNTYLDLRD